MSNTHSELGHLIDLIDTLTCQIVQTIEISFVLLDAQLAIGLGDADDRLEDIALTLLDPLTHGVEVGREVDSGIEDPLMVLPFALAVELLPPLTDVM